MMFFSKKLLLFFFLFGYALPTTAQQLKERVEDYWHFGKVILATGDTLICNFRFDLDKEILQTELQNTTQIYSANKVKAFQLYDRTVQKERYYKTLSYKKSNYKTPTFFELILEDSPISLLGRETKLVDTVRYIVSNQMSLYSIPQAYRYYNGSKHQFYFLYPNGRVKEFDGRKKNLLTLFADRKKQIKSYLKKYNYNVIREQSFIALIQYYNQLKKPVPKTK